MSSFLRCLDFSSETLSRARVRVLPSWTNYNTNEIHQRSVCNRIDRSQKFNGTLLMTERNEFERYSSSKIVKIRKGESPGLSGFKCAGNPGLSPIRINSRISPFGHPFSPQLYRRVHATFALFSYYGAASRESDSTPLP